MSYCKQEGKDKIIFATEDYLSQPSTATLLPDESREIDTSNAGAILPNGEINWDCPCLGNLPNGPCGPSFRQAFSCWVENKDNEEGFAENCIETFSTWEKCLGENRDIYKPSNDEASKDNNSQSVAEQPSLSAAKENLEIKDSVSSVDEQSQAALPNRETRAIAAASTATSKT